MTKAFLLIDDWLLFEKAFPKVSTTGHFVIFYVQNKSIPAPNSPIPRLALVLSFYEANESKSKVATPQDDTAPDGVETPPPTVQSPLVLFQSATSGEDPSPHQKYFHTSTSETMDNEESSPRTIPTCNVGNPDHEYTPWAGASKVSANRGETVPSSNQNI